jgi:HEAT repeat protein
MIPALGWASCVLGAATLLLLFILATRRVTLARDARRRLSAEERLRPVVLALVETGAEPPPSLSGKEIHVLATILARYARQLRGEALTNFAAYFERRGDVEREVATLSSRRAWRRAAAAHSLGGMGSLNAVPALVEALSDPDRDVAAAAARSLGRLRAVEAVEALVYALVDGRLPRAVTAHALLSIGTGGVPRLRGLLTEGPAEVTVFALDLIGLLGTAGDSSQLIELLRDPSAEVRAHAARALGRLGAEEAAEELRRALADRIPFVRVNAAHALGAIGDTLAVPILARQAREDGFDAAEAAARALARVAPQILPAVAAEPGAGPHLAQAADLAAAAR